MTFIQILVLSLIQSLTEFLPVSSSAHLILLPALLGWSEQGLEMDIALHVGTLIAVLFYFRKDLGSMITHCIKYIAGGFRAENFKGHVRLSFNLVLATLPAVVTGFILKKTGFANLRNVHVIASMSIAFGLVLFAADHWGAHRKQEEQMTLGQGFLIGLGQAIALIPGVSRSGICMSVGLLLGFTRVAAARFAFLLSIPSVAGAATLTIYDAVKEGCAFPWQGMGWGIFFSALASLAAIHLILGFLGRYTLTPFVIYRILLGTSIWIKL